ncbi:hypothetical protein JCM8202_006206 [Rhodotorula sphaerocarpa]
MRLASAVSAWASLASLLASASAASASPAASRVPSAPQRLPQEPRPVLAASHNPDNPEGVTLYVTEPACGFYRCTVTWPIGSKVAVNWIHPTPGNVSVLLESNIGGPTYTIAESIPSISQEGYCDSGAGVGVVQPGHVCGMVQFVVPDGWQQMNNYTIVVQSLSDPSMAGYTDMITIAPANSSSPSHVPASEIPSGTVASILTIPAPTSTDFGASTWYTGSTPAPTAVTGATSSPTTVANTPPPADSSGGSSTVSSQFSTAAAVSSLGTTHTTGGAAAAAAGSSTSPTSGALGSATAPASTYLALVASCVLALLA